MKPPTPYSAEVFDMSQGSIRASALSIAGAYFFMFVLVFWPVVDLTSSVWPLQPGNLQWRYGSMGLLAAYLHTPILAIVLSMGLAFVLRQRAALRLLSILSFFGVLVLFLVLVLFPLDVIQLRGTVAEEALPSFQAGALLAELKHFTAFISLLLLGIGGWRTVGRLSRKSRASQASQLTADVLKAQKRA